MKIAFIYAGQGSQYVGMGQELYNTYPIFKSTFDSVDKNGDLKKLCFEGSLEELSKTSNTQPCMVAFAVSVTALLNSLGISPEIVAGLSLGEYSALSAANVFDAKTAVELVSFRGKAMEKASEGFNCSMSAVLGADRHDLLKACEEASSLGIVEIANYNSPTQQVIGGETNAVNRAGEILLSLSAKRIIPLNVSGAFHTSLMKRAGDDLREKFKEIKFESMTVPVIFNATADILKSGETIPTLLEKQVQSSVFFEDSIKRMENMGVDTIIEIGPGKILSGFVRKTSKNIKCFNIEDNDSLSKTLNSLKGE